MLAVFCIIAFFANNTALRPDIMETRNLQTAREMVEGDHWLVPMMNGNYRLEKPPSLALVEGRKGARPGLEVLPALILTGPDGRDTAELRRIYHREED